MSLGERIKQLRHENHMTQEELGKKIGVHQKQVSAYERDVHVPSTEVLIRIAETFNISLDFLAFEARGKESLIKIHDRELLKRFETLDQMPEHERELAREILDLVITRHRFRKLAQSEDI